MRILYSELPACVMNEFVDLYDTLLLTSVAGLTERDVGRDVYNAEFPLGEEHGVFLGICKGGINLGMTVVVMPGKMDGLFIERCCAGAVYLFFHGEVYGFHHILKSGMATLLLNLSELKGLSQAEDGMR